MYFNQLFKPCNTTTENLCLCYYGSINFVYLALLGTYIFLSLILHLI